MDKNELAHFGVMGMKWGIRRFQNPDGTLTSLGRKRYDVGPPVKNIKVRKSEYKFVGGGGSGGKPPKNNSSAGSKRDPSSSNKKANSKTNKVSGSVLPKDKKESWTKKELRTSQHLIKETSDMTKHVSDLEKKTRPKIDLSHMTEKDMRDRINRELLENQYRSVFEGEMNSQLSSGRQFTMNTLETIGTALAVTGTAVSIALAIKELKEKSD